MIAGNRKNSQFFFIGARRKRKISPRFSRQCKLWKIQRVLEVFRPVFSPVSSAKCKNTKMWSTAKKNSRIFENCGQKSEVLKKNTRNIRRSESSIYPRNVICSSSSVWEKNRLRVFSLRVYYMYIYIFFFYFIQVTVRMLVKLRVCDSSLEVALSLSPFSFLREIFRGGTKHIEIIIGSGRIFKESTAIIARPFRYYITTWPMRAQGVIRDFAIQNIIVFIVIIMAVRAKPWGRIFLSKMMVLTALKQVATAATNAVHSATSVVHSASSTSGRLRLKLDQTLFAVSMYFLNKTYVKHKNI